MMRFDRRCFLRTTTLPRRLALRAEVSSPLEVQPCQIDPTSVPTPTGWPSAAIGIGVHWTAQTVPRTVNRCRSRRRSMPST